MHGLPEPAPQTVIGVMAKWPSAGRTKTRLIPLLGPEGAADAARVLLERTLRWIDDAPASVRAVLWTDGGTLGDWLDVLTGLKQPSRWTLQPQPAGHLGERMRTAMSYQLGLARNAVLLGTDTPTLGLQHVDRVCTRLQTHDAVFVPALDGGYVMVGMRTVCEPAFGPLDWGTERVAQQTRQALDAGGYTHAWLDAEPDIDEPADWEMAKQRGWI